MRELEELEWREGAAARRVREGTDGGLATWACAAIFASEARPRSGLAYAAGFAALCYLFRPSADALAVQCLGNIGAGVGWLWSAAAPVAMMFGLAAARDIDRAPWKVGRAQAIVGYLIGLPGTLRLVYDLFLDL